MKTLTIHILLALLCLALLSCADNPTAPDTLTEADIEALIDARVAEQIAKMNGNHDDTVTPQEIADNALQSTVFLRINTPHKNHIGSGFTVGKGLIATCNHVLEGMTSATAEPVLHNRQYTITEVIAVDKKHDIAIIRALDFNKPALPLGDSDSVRIGEKVYMVSTPVKRLYKGSFVSGVVSGIRDDASKLFEGVVIQTTLPTDAGSSGGAVLNGEGKVIGVHEGLDRDGTLIRLAVPVNHLKSLLSTIR